MFISNSHPDSWREPMLFMVGISRYGSHFASVVCPRYNDPWGRLKMYRCIRFIDIWEFSLIEGYWQDIPTLVYIMKCYEFCLLISFLHLGWVFCNEVDAGRTGILRSPLWPGAIFEASDPDRIQTELQYLTHRTQAGAKAQSEVTADLSWSTRDIYIVQWWCII